MRIHLTNVRSISLALLLGAPAIALAERPELPAPTSAEDEARAKQLGRKVQEALRAHGDDVHGCYASALDENPKVEGEVLLLLSVAPGGAVSRAEVLKDQTGSRKLTDCLLARMRGWKLPELASATTEMVAFPLAFHPGGPEQLPRKVRHVVPLADAGPGPIGKGRDPAVTARVLIDAETVGETQASLTHVELKPSARLALHTHPGTLELLYVEKGMARVRGRGPGTLETARAGDVIVVPPNVAHSLEAAPLARLSLIQIFAPAGAEHGYRDPSDRSGTVPAARVPPKKEDPTAVVVRADEAKPYRILGGKAEARLYLDGRGWDRASLQRLEAEPGVLVPAHAHAQSDELLFILEGRGEMTVGDEKLPVAAGDGIHIPHGATHSLTVTDKLVAVQCYAPAGPEQRFKTASAPSPSAPPEPNRK